MAITCAVRWNYRRHYISTDRWYNGDQTLSFSSDGTSPISNEGFNNTDQEFLNVSLVVSNPLPSNVGGVFMLRAVLQVEVLYLLILLLVLLFLEVL